MRFTPKGICTALLLGGIAQANAGMVDAKLLDMLKANGSITAAQHAELSTDLKREQEAEAKVATEQASASDVRELKEKLAWASATQFKGDMRVRNETVGIDGEASNGGRDKSRQRVRARLGAFSAINPQVDTGIQVASGSSSDRRSTNQDLDNYFDKKSLWLDLAYIDYHPEAAPNLHLTGGKMKQPWVAVGDIAWDGDVNPEGFVASYSTKAGAAEVFGSGGYFVMKDNVDGEGVKFDHDLKLYTLQLGTRFKTTDNVAMMLGASFNDFDNAEFSSSLRANGNTTDKFRLFELFGQMDVSGMPLPLSLYGQYIVNDAARDFGGFQDGNEDTAWLFGVKTKIGNVSFDYNYRDVQANAVVGALTDSDFASGYVDSSGHKFKIKYDLLTNFAVGLAYFRAESDAASRFVNNADVNVLHLDVEAKF